MSTSDESRLAACWRHQECSSCLDSKHGCGWCPYSSTCIPVSSLLEPISKANTCPLSNERFELRTKALGCGCSTTTLLSIIVAVFATVAAVLVLYRIGLVLWRLNETFGTDSWRGTVLEIKDGEIREDYDWRRKGGWTTRIATFLRPERVHSDRSEQEQVTERSRLIGTQA